MRSGPVPAGSIAGRERPRPGHDDVPRDGVAGGALRDAAAGDAAAGPARRPARRPHRAHRGHRVRRDLRAGAAVPRARDAAVGGARGVGLAGRAPPGPARASGARRAGGRGRGAGPARVRVRVGAGGPPAHRAGRARGGRVRVPARGPGDQPRGAGGHGRRVPRPPRDGRRPAARVRRHGRGCRVALDAGRPPGVDPGPAAPPAAGRRHAAVGRVLRDRAPRRRRRRRVPRARWSRGGGVHGARAAAPGSTASPGTSSSPSP